MRTFTERPNRRGTQDAGQVRSPAHGRPSAEDPHRDAAAEPLTAPAHPGPHFRPTPPSSVSAPKDALEREADQVADRLTGPGTVQRTTASASGDSGSVAVRPDPGTVARGLTGGGGPLPRSIRTHFEPRLGHDFSLVRVHADADAAASAAALQANAYTVGNHIVFGAGRYRPGHEDTQRLLAHELTHVVQQDRLGPTGVVHRDLAIAPTTPDGAAATLTPAQIASATTFNGATLTRAGEIELLRDILGLDGVPAVIDDAFVQAVAVYQAQNGLTPDGKIGPSTRRRLSLEILAEARFLGFTGLGGLQVGVDLRSQIDTLIGAGNTTYADWRTRIRAATVLQRDVVLAEAAFLIRMRDHLSTFDDLARCIELLGRRAPTHAQLIADRTVVAELRAAWVASSPTLNPPGGTQHEEGGWVYLNIITNAITVRRAPAGGGAIINLSAPPVVADSIVVGTYHTHPNLGPGWQAGPSGPDGTADAADAVPGIVVGSTGLTAAAPTTFFASGPDRRAHLAGSQSLPSAPVAPQAKADGTYDER